MIARGGGRPGLLGTMARTAVVAGTATAVSGGMRRRQLARDEQAAQAAVYQQQQEPADDVVGEITKLADLRAAGVLTDAEFAAAKAKLLG
jgi:membrane protease subunit (stomatin/prohibitin family)